MRLENPVHIIEYGNNIIPYTLIYSGRRTLGITVTTDCNVIVRAPFFSSKEMINNILNKKSKWILNKLNYFKSIPPPPPERRYISGETHYFLGKQFRLKIVKSPWEDVKLKGAYIFVYTLNGENKRVVQVLLDNWYKDKAWKNLNVYVKKWLPKFKKFNISTPRLKINKMKRRWGSCNTKDRITLNMHLIKTPLKCIDYVIIHELCHLRFKNHDYKYYNLLSSILPDWKSRKKKLEKFIF